MGAFSLVKTVSIPGGLKSYFKKAVSADRAGLTAASNWSVQKSPLGLEAVAQRTRIAQWFFTQLLNDSIGRECHKPSLIGKE